mgnify:CR=1 FL=1
MSDALFLLTPALLLLHTSALYIPLPLQITQFC